MHAFYTPGMLCKVVLNISNLENIDAKLNSLSNKGVLPTKSFLDNMKTGLEHLYFFNPLIS